MHITGHDQYVQCDPAKSVYTLEKAGEDKGSIIGYWYHPYLMTMDLTYKDQVPHQLALYFYDWDYKPLHVKRVKVYAYDGDSGQLLGSQMVYPMSTDPGQGVYLVWKAKGHVKIQIAYTHQSVGAFVNGIFFDPLPV